MRSEYEEVVIKESVEEVKVGSVEKVKVGVEVKVKGCVPQLKTLAWQPSWSQNNPNYSKAGERCAEAVGEALSVRIVWLSLWSTLPESRKYELLQARDAFALPELVWDGQSKDRW